MRVGEICKRDIPTLRADDSLIAAIRLFAEEHVTDLLVVDAGGDVAGVLGERDVLAALALRDVHRPFGLTVGDMRVEPARVAKPSDDVGAVVRALLSEGRRVAAVVHDGRLVGALSLGDLMHVIARDPSNAVELAIADADPASSDRAH